MQYRDLTAADKELIAAAFEVIRRNFWQDHHHVGAAIRAGSGKIYTGVHMASPGIDVCAEWSALGAAASAGERTFTCCVAVKRGGKDGSSPEVMSPCGVCRELLYHYGPQTEVIVPTPDGPRKVSIADLLPLPYAASRPAEPGAGRQ